MPSPIQKKILAALDRHLQAHGESPTLAELGERVNIRSRGTMHRHVSQMVSEGLLEKSPRHWRGLRPVNSPAAKLAASLPMLGRIAAGKPIEAVAGIEEVDLGQLLCRPGRYMLQVVGESMTGMGLLDGDYVIIEQQNHAQNGQVVVALIDEEEATLKRFYLRDNGQVELVAENESVAPMTFPADRVRIQGVLAGQMRVY